MLFIILNPNIYINNHYNYNIFFLFCQYEICFFTPKARKTCPTDKKASVAGRQNVVFKSSNVPIALEFVQRPQTMYRGNGELYFASLPGRRFSLFVSGDGLEKVCAKVFSPSGKKVFEESEISGWRRVQPNAGDVEAGLWRIELSKPPTGAYFDDYFLDLSGVPGLMFLSPEKYWLPR